MAAPSGTIWGNIGNGYLKLGIYTSTTTTATQVTVNVEVWLATKYAVQDPSNTFYYNNSQTALPNGADNVAKTNIDIKTYHSSGNGWSTTNHQKLASYSTTYNRGTSDNTRYLYSKITGVWTTSTNNGSASVSRTVIIPKLQTYTVSYNANGGVGAPPAQTKYYGTNITLSNTKPTRTGYSFKGWGVSTTDTTVDYNPGVSYTKNANATLYAIWQANTYTVSYNANGGTGAPASQYKTYGVNMTLSSTKPTRTNYTFKGWGTSATATSATYSAGATYTTNANITLYAVWELAYTKPRITGISVDRCKSHDDATLSDEGVYVRVKFNWACDKTVSSIKIDWKESSVSSYPSANTATVSASGTSANNVVKIIGTSSNNMSLEKSYTVRITVTDSSGSTPVERTVNGMRIPIDILAQNKGIAFGKPASIANAAEFAYDTRFNGFSNFYGNSRSHGTAAFDGHVIGKVYGMHGLVAIPANSDLNNYLTPGCYSIGASNDAATVSNIPEKVAGRLFVYTSNGAYTTFNTDTSISSTWCSLCQEYHTFAAPDKNNEYCLPPIVYKRIVKESGGNITYGPWIRQNGEKILWSPSGTTGLWMRDGQTIELSEPISRQPTGIVLAFSLYDKTNSANKDASWHTFFVPKGMINLYNGGYQTFWMSINSGFSVVGAKYLKIEDDKITGQASNDDSGTNSGIMYDNAQFVLRYVIGM